MESSSHVSDTQVLDLKVHASICLQVFDRLQKLPTYRKAGDSCQELCLLNSTQSLSVIYEDASCLLNSLLKMGSLENLSTLVRFSDPSCDSAGPSMANSIVQDLLLLTSFLCTDVLEQGRAKTCNVSQRFRQTSLTSVLISLAPFWAIASLMTQLPALPVDKRDTREKEIVKCALKTFLQSQVTLQNTIGLVEEALNRISLLESRFLSTLEPGIAHSSPVVQDSIVFSLISRLRKALRTHLSSPLLFSVVLMFSLRMDLSTTGQLISADSSSDKIEKFDEILKYSDQNSLQLLEYVLLLAPRLVVQQDLSNMRLSPFIYLVSHRPAMLTTSTSGTKYCPEQLVLQSVQLFTKYVPSVVSISDSKGMYPLHYAARRGYGAVLRYLAARYGSLSLSLMDATGKYPLHHALLNPLLCHDDIIDLASMCPQLLLSNAPWLFSSSSAAVHSQHMSSVDPISSSNGHADAASTIALQSRHPHCETAFNPLQFAKKSSIVLYERLVDVGLRYSREQDDRFAKTFLQSDSSSSLSLSLSSTQRNGDCDESEVSDDDEDRDSIETSSSDNHSVTTNDSLSSSSHSHSSPYFANTTKNRKRSASSAVISTAETESANSKRHKLDHQLPIKHSLEDMRVEFCAQSLLLLQHAHTEEL